MFTGIITAVAEVTASRQSGGNLAVAVQTPPRWKVRVGESVAVNGICSTVVAVRGGVMRFEYMPETVRKTTTASWRTGDRVNLECSLRYGDALDGHLVMGHVDGVGQIVEVKKEGSSRVFRIGVSSKLMWLIAPKGSVAVDGVSLTVVAAGREHFTVALTPYTFAHTNLRERRIGDRVNVETDILAKYAKKLSRSCSR